MFCVIFLSILFAILSPSSGLFWHNHHQSREESSDKTSDVHTIPLGSEATFHWRVDFMSEVIIAEVHYIGTDNTWFAIGFSNYGEPKPADYCVLWIDWHRQIQLQDAWADDEGKLNLDPQQDCDNFAWRRRGNVTKFTFSRKFDTCDENDYIMERGTTHLVWLKGLGPLSSLAGLQVSDAESSGMTRAELVRVLHKKPTFPSNAWQLEMLAHRVKVPNKETTYWCHVQKLPPILSQKHHVLQFGPVIQAGNEHLVHHMEVFHCAGPDDLEIPLYDGPCDAADRPEKTQICKKVLAAWAMGADAFVYPEETGLSIGGPNFNSYVMLEVHYNNPELQDGHVDSSGIRFILTKTLRKYDAGVIELGLEYTDKMAIPPQQEAFTLSGHCIQECTGVGLPQHGIHIFASQLHTHLTGVKVITRHIRDGEELSPLNYDNHYSTHFQEIRLLPKHVTVLPVRIWPSPQLQRWSLTDSAADMSAFILQDKPIMEKNKKERINGVCETPPLQWRANIIGDSLITTCTYNTMDRKNVTLGGFAISDEMCVNYIHYYPNARLEVCKSAISDDALRTYFRYMREWENQVTSVENGISDNYKSIEWTKVRVAGLHDLYEAAPLGMQCNGSDGSRLPGLWDNIAATAVRLPTPPPARNCLDASLQREVINSM